MLFKKQTVYIFSLVFFTFAINYTYADDDPVIDKSITVETAQNYKDNIQDVNEQLKAEKEFNQAVRVYGVIVISILSLLVLSFSKNNRLRLKSNKLLKEQADALKKEKEKAEAALEIKSEFLSTVTHELRTPLYAVVNLASNLLEESPKRTQVSQLNSLKKSGDYLLSLVNDILNFNRLEANREQVNISSFNLRKTVEDVIDSLSKSAENNNTKIHYSFDEQLPEFVESDQVKISQILYNLIGNAIKFTKDGDVWVTTSITIKSNHHKIYTFQIKDNGIGISQTQQQQIFEKFDQGSIEINRKYGGTGLGLAITKKLIDILDGELTLDSELHKGSTFTLNFDCDESEHEAVEKPNANAALKAINIKTKKNFKILVVDDNKINQMITKKVLSKLDLNCDLANSGKTAITKLKATDYDLVLMDIHMPEMSGFEATKAIRVFNKTSTIYALTAIDLNNQMHKFESAGFNDVISKPFNQDEFNEKLYNALLKKKELIATTKIQN